MRTAVLVLVHAIGFLLVAGAAAAAIGAALVIGFERSLGIRSAPRKP